MKRETSDLSSDLVKVINNAGKEAKVQMARLADRNKVLESDLELMASEAERVRQISQRQQQEKASSIQQLQEVVAVVSSEKGEAEAEGQMQV